MVRRRNSWKKNVSCRKVERALHAAICRENTGGINILIVWKHVNWKLQFDATSEIASQDGTVFSVWNHFQLNYSLLPSAADNAAVVCCWTAAVPASVHCWLCFSSTSWTLLQKFSGFCGFFFNCIMTAYSRLMDTGRACVNTQSSAVSCCKLHSFCFPVSHIWIMWQPLDLQ